MFGLTTAFDAFEGFQERVLSHVFGVRGSGKHRQSDRVSGAQIALHQSCERSVVTPLGATDELCGFGLR